MTNGQFKDRFGIGVTELSALAGKQAKWGGAFLRSGGRGTLKTLVEVQAVLGVPLDDLVRIVLPEWQPVAPADAAVRRAA